MKGTNTTDIYSNHFGSAWFELLNQLEVSGNPVSPRAQGTRELRGVKLVVSEGLNNVFYSAHRGLQWRFAVAEWLWIWFGRNDVASIKRFNPKIASMASDDGVIFQGAYGPKVRAQWAEKIRLLQDDPDSRQAVIQIYETPAVPTKDVPCTLSLQFFVREGNLETIVNMRSSDIWLGLPYDFYNFSMLANIAAAQLGLNVGSVTMHLGSSHLYERDRSKAASVLFQPPPANLTSRPLPGEPPSALDLVLDGSPVDYRELGHELWVNFAEVLTASNNGDAFHRFLRGLVLGPPAEPWE